MTSLPHLLQNALPVPIERSSLPRPLYLPVALRVIGKQSPPVVDRVLEILIDRLLDVVRTLELVEGSKVFVDLK